MDFLIKNVNFSEEELKIILDKFNRINLAKGELFLREGQVCQKIGFINSGTLTLSQTNDKGTEHILDFFLTGNMISDYYSFLKQIPSDANIKALTATNLSVITKNDLDFLFETIPNYQKLGRLLAEKHFIRLAEKIKTSYLTPLERYQLLIKQRPLVFQSFPQYMIASYLGIRPEWLSKIRAQM